MGPGSDERTTKAGDSRDDLPTLVIGGIPDQQLSVLEERFGGVADFLSEQLGIEVRYQPAIPYASLVTAFRNGDVKLAWFGGLTGVQARLAAPGTEAIVQRPRDREFESVFIVGAGVNASTLVDLAGKSFTFGSESSTSGHLMPRAFLTEIGIDPESDLSGPPSYSGSHDKTWKLVEAGTFEAGALSAAVWERAVARGQVDQTRVRLLHRTPSYFDYHWAVHPSVDEVFGGGTARQIKVALLNLSVDGRQARTLELFQTDEFVETDNSNYAAIEQVARDLGLVE